jgi:hypothetical protein
MSNLDSADDTALRFDLREAFKARQRQLEINLGFGRSVASHPGTIGDASELDWRGMLTGFLPRRYRASKAFVVDVRGGISDQLDVVVHDRQYSPSLFEVGGAQYIPAESVHAVFEVKQVINKEYVEYAGKKIASVRNLHRTSSGFPTATGFVEPRPLPRILGGILALESGWNPPLGQPFRDAIADRTSDEVLDLGYAVKAGSFELPNSASLREVSLCDDPDTALIFFLLRLLKRLQDQATVVAIDVDEYTRSVWPGATPPEK